MTGQSTQMTEKGRSKKDIVLGGLAAAASAVVVARVYVAYMYRESVGLGSDDILAQLGGLMIMLVVWAGLAWVLLLAMYWVDSIVSPGERRKRKQREADAAEAREKSSAALREMQAEDARLRLEAETKQQAKSDAKSETALRRKEFDASILRHCRIFLYDWYERRRFEELDLPPRFRTFRLKFDGELLEGESVTVSASIDLLNEDGEPAAPRGWRVRTTFTADRLVAMETLYETPPEAVDVKVWHWTVHDFVSPHRSRP